MVKETANHTGERGECQDKSGGGSKGKIMQGL